MGQPPVAARRDHVEASEALEPVGPDEDGRVGVEAHPARVVYGLQAVRTAIYCGPTKEALMYNLVLLLTTLVACDASPTEEIGDSADVADTSDTSDTGEPPNLTFVLSGSFAGATLGLTWLDAASVGSGGTFVFGDTLASVAVTGSAQGLYAAAPDASLLTEIDPVAAPGMLVGFYVPTLHLDSDGDGLQNGEEAYIGVGTTWAIYASGPVPADLAAGGLAEGWNTLDAVSQSETADFGDPVDIPLSASLAQVDSVTIGGTIAGDVDGVGLTTVSAVLFGGGSVEAPLYDEPATAEWSMTLSGNPPADHLMPLDFLQVDGAMELPNTYADIDGSASFGDEDSPLLPVCLDGSPVALFWLPTSTTLNAAMKATITGWGTGWSVSLLSESGGTVSGDDRTRLTVDESCSRR